MISICIPVYERGREWLPELLESIERQTFCNYEIVTSEGVPGAAANLNAAIRLAKGNIIKPMFQDDKFIEPDSLQKIADAMERSEWVACTSRNVGLENYDHVPYIHRTLQALREGENTYGCPSAMAWHRNELKFDEKLHWLFDCEFYARMCETYGTPRFVDTPIYIRQWEGQATRTSADGHQRVLDTNAVIEKYRSIA